MTLFFFVQSAEEAAKVSGTTAEVQPAAGQQLRRQEQPPAGRFRSGGRPQVRVLELAAQGAQLQVLEQPLGSGEPPAQAPVRPPPAVQQHDAAGHSEDQPHTGPPRQQGPFPWQPRQQPPAPQDQNKSRFFFVFNNE